MTEHFDAYFTALRETIKAKINALEYSGYPVEGIPNPSVKMFLLDADQQFCDPEVTYMCSTIGFRSLDSLLDFVHRYRILQFLVHVQYDTGYRRLGAAKQQASEDDQKLYRATFSNELPWYTRLKYWWRYGSNN